ncbi:MAG TPA: 50S ribosomal protein L29 [Phycisphaerales bacterium]|nr:50S ribosomal protein L29 [Phycisphaerales bacterium]
MKAAEVHKMTGEEIDAEVEKLKKRIYDLRCQAATEKIEDPSLFRKIRRDAARLLTERRARILRHEAEHAPKTEKAHKAPAAKPAKKSAKAATAKKPVTRKKTTTKKAKA